MVINVSNQMIVAVATINYAIECNLTGQIIKRAVIVVVIVWFGYYLSTQDSNHFIAKPVVDAIFKHLDSQKIFQCLILLDKNLQMFLKQIMEMASLITNSSDFLLQQSFFIILSAYVGAQCFFFLVHELYLFYLIPNFVLYALKANFILSDSQFPSITTILVSMPIF